MPRPMSMMGTAWYIMVKLRPRMTPMPSIHVRANIRARRLTTVSKTER